MTISMYQASAPRFVNGLGNLAAILDKAQAHVDAKKLDPAALTTYRLYPDMLPFTRQVQIACDASKGAVARLAGVEIPQHQDVETSIADLQARIAKTVAFIDTFKPAQIFYFHVATAYNILRHNGVELGKRDFIGNP